MEEELTDEQKAVVNLLCGKEKGRFGTISKDTLEKMEEKYGRYFSNSNYFGFKCRQLNRSLIERIALCIKEGHKSIDPFTPCIEAVVLYSAGMAFRGAEEKARNLPEMYEGYPVVVSYGRKEK